MHGGAISGELFLRCPTWWDIVRVVATQESLSFLFLGGVQRLGVQVSRGKRKLNCQPVA